MRKGPPEANVSCILRIYRRRGKRKLKRPVGLQSQSCLMCRRPGLLLHRGRLTSDSNETADDNTPPGEQTRYFACGPARMTKVNCYFTTGGLFDLENYDTLIF